MDFVRSLRTKSNIFPEQAKNTRKNNWSSRSAKVVDSKMVPSHNRSNGDLFKRTGNEENSCLTRLHKKSKELPSLFESTLHISSPLSSPHVQLVKSITPKLATIVEDLDSQELEILNLQNKKRPDSRFAMPELERPYTPQTLNLLDEVVGIVECEYQKIQEIELILDLIKSKKSISVELQCYAETVDYLDISELTCNVLYIITDLFKNLITLNMPKDVKDEDLIHILKLPKLRRLSLEGCDNITDVGVKFLTQHPCLEYINLSGCFGITGTGFSFATEESCINHLDLSFCLGISYSGVESIAGLKNLKTLSLEGSDHLTETDLQILAQNRTLEILNLAGCVNISGRTLCMEGSLISLKVLDMSDCGVTDMVLDIISKLPSIKRVNLNGCSNISSRGIAEFKLIPNLKVEFFDALDSD